MVELGCNLVAKQPASTTWRDSPGVNILRITPNQITKGTFVRNFLSTGNDADLINCADLWAQTTVNTKNFAIHNSGKDEEVKDLAARFPNRSIAVLLLTLLVKTIDLSDLTRFVITPDKGDLVGIPCVVSKT